MSSLEAVASRVPHGLLFCPPACGTVLRAVASLGGWGRDGSLRPWMLVLTMVPDFFSVLLGKKQCEQPLPHVPAASSASTPYTGMGCTLSETASKMTPSSCVVWSQYVEHSHPGTIGKGQTDQAQGVITEGAPSRQPSS